jgi:hypothetical protein
MDYIDIHLSHVAQFVWFGFLGHLDVAVVEVAGILPNGRLIPSTSIGNNKTWLDQADRIIIEVNSWMNPALLGMHDIYYGTRLPPYRTPIPILSAGDRIGETTFRCDPDKIIAVVETNAPDRNTAFAAPDPVSNAIAGHILEFFEHEVRQGRLPRTLLPLQSGVGNVANAVMAGLKDGPFPHLTAYTEVLQDGMFNLIRSGCMDLASATALSLSSEAALQFNQEIESLRDRIVLRPQEISNHPEVIRRLGVIAMNGLIEADIYGNVNSTHLRGTSIMNGIGGSGDFARNAFLSIFMTPSIAKGGTISWSPSRGSPIFAACRRSNAPKSSSPRPRIRRSARRSPTISSAPAGCRLASTRHISSMRSSAPSSPPQQPDLRADTPFSPDVAERVGVSAVALTIEAFADTTAGAPFALKPPMGTRRPAPRRPMRDQLADAGHGCDRGTFLRT